MPGIKGTEENYNDSRDKASALYRDANIISYLLRDDARAENER